METTFSKRAISEVIAALMVIGITVAAGTLFAVYASGTMARIQGQVNQPYTEQLTLDYYTWVTVTNGPKITIRNDGAAPITLMDFFMQGVKNTSDLTTTSCPSPNAYVLPVQSSCTLTFPNPTGLTVTSGVAYTVKLVAKDGTTFTFSCIAGSYTH